MIVAVKSEPVFTFEHAISVLATSGRPLAVRLRELSLQGEQIEKTLHFLEFKSCFSGAGSYFGG